ncbi:hypothetical protein DVH24_017561 [Malus domestica]|uniref:Myb-like domain-containing protein n=1 Tax=Malus domestica TaxID=3750 RepID=A0A498KBG5_MALDO|nr:hypothetical protein DVH24_017561 [Malus domestica]
MASFAMKGRAWSRKEDKTLCKAYRWVSEDSVRGNCQTNDDRVRPILIGKKKEIMTRRQLFTSDYTPTMADDENDVDYGY